MKLFLNIILLSFLSCLSAYSQVLTVVTRNPMPSSLAEWQRDRSLIQVVIINQAGASAKPNCFIGYVLKDANSGKVIAQSDNNHPAIPRFSIPAGPSTITRLGNQVINENSSIFDASIRTQVITTNSIPEGNYDFCVTLFDERGTAIGELGELCRFFTVTIPDPPMLIAPQHQQSINKALLPVFSWTPVITGTVNSLHYSIKVCPVFEGQNDRFAIDNNPILHENKRVTSTTYMYPPSALSFSSYTGAIGFVWQVQALQGNGMPATRNNGKSEIHRFTFTSSNDQTNNSETGNGGNVNGGVWNDLTGNSGADSIKNGIHSNGATFRTVKIGEHEYSFVNPQTCGRYCIIKGQLKGKTPFADDSLLFTSQGLEVRNINNVLVAVKGSIVHVWKQRPLMFKAVSVLPKTITVSQIGNFVEGDIVVDWNALGLRGKSEVLQLKTQWNDEGLLQSTSKTNQRFYLDNKESNCVYLQVDTVVTSLKFSPKFTLISHAKARCNLQCTPDGTLQMLGVCSIALDEPNPENLLFTLPIEGQSFSLRHTPITLSGKELLIDFSTDVNFSGISVQPQCAAVRASNPVWKGMIIPEATVQSALDSKTISFTAKDVVLDVSTSLKASFSTATSVAQKINIDEFSFSVDSVYFAICNNNPLEARFTSSVLLHESGYKIPSTWSIFKKLPLSLYFDGAWKLFGHANLMNSVLDFGGISRIYLSGAQLRLEKEKYVIDFFSNKVEYSSKVKNKTPFPNFTLSKGNAYVEKEHWKQLPQRYSTMFDEYTFELSHIGLGYDDERFWLGLSGELLPPEGSGLTTLPLQKIQVFGGAERKIVSEKRMTSVRLGGVISAEFSLGIEFDEMLKDYAIKGNGSLNVPWYDKQIRADFVYGAKDSYQFYRINAMDQRDNPVELLRDFEVSSLFLNIGWNVNIESLKANDVKTLLMNGGVYSPIREISIEEIPLYCHGLMMIQDSKSQSFRSLLSFQQSIGTKKGELGGIIQASGDYVIHPRIGFASGRFETQWSSLQRIREVSLLGDIVLALPERQKTNAHIQFSQSNTLKAVFGPFDGIISGLSEHNGDVMTLMQCTQSYWQFSPNMLTLRGNITTYGGISGIPEGQIRPISLMQMVHPQRVCFESTLETKGTSTEFNLRFGKNTSNLFASFDAFPCLSKIGFLSYLSVKDAITIENDALTLKTQGLGKSCNSRSFIVGTGSMLTATNIQLKNEEELATLRLGEKSFIIPRFKVPKPEISGAVEAEYLQKSIRFTLGENSDYRCEDKMLNDKQNIYNSTAFNVGVTLENNGNVINKGKLLPKGTRLLLTIVTNEQGKQKSNTYPLTLRVPLQTNSSLSLRSLLNQNIKYRVLKMRVVLSDYEDSDMQDNCASDGTNSCE